MPATTHLYSVIWYLSCLCCALLTDCGACVHKQCLKEMENDCQPSAKYVNGGESV